MDGPLPVVQEEIVSIPNLAPLELVQGRIVEQSVDVTLPKTQVIMSIHDQPAGEDGSGSKRGWLAVHPQLHRDR